jgi:hypothetical protein
VLLRRAHDPLAAHRETHEKAWRSLFPQPPGFAGIFAVELPNAYGQEPIDAAIPDQVSAVSQVLILWD